MFTDQGTLIRSSTDKEEKLIKENYRYGSDVPVKYRPDLYEHWTWGKRNDIAQIMSEFGSTSNNDIDDSLNDEPISSRSQTILSIYQ